jgi:beta-N-acetylhexosaminidase
VAGCGTHRSLGSASAPSPVTAPALALSPSGLPTAPGSADSVTRCVIQQSAAMTPRARAGQLFLLGMAADGSAPVASALATSAPGGVFLTGRGRAGTAATARLLTQTQRSATAGPGHDRVGMITAVDQEGGEIQVLSGPGFDTMPSASVQGSWDPDTLRQAAARWGTQLRSAGINVDLAPVTDVLSPALGTANAPIGRYHRAYGTNPTTVAEHAGAFVAGMTEAGVQSTVKHFPGLGQVRGNTDLSAGVTDDHTGLNDPTLAPFTIAAHAGDAWTMVSTAIYTKIDPATPAAFSPTVIAALRDRTTPGRLVLSDDLGNATQVSATAPGQRAVRFLAAGGDIALTATPTTLGPMIDAVLARTQQDPTFAGQVNAAVLRVLTAKQHMGLLQPNC